MHVLVLNPGSSTLKYRLVEIAAGATREVLAGAHDHVAGDALADAAARVIQQCRSSSIDAVGCRVVHGGEHFAEPTLVTPEVIVTIRELGRLAPLHNPTACAVLPSDPPPGPFQSSITLCETKPSTASAMSVSQEPRRNSPSV